MGTVQALGARGDIVFEPGDRTYALQHSSVARFYVETAKAYTDLLDGILHVGRVEPFDQELLHLYIQHMPANYDAVSTRLRYEVEMFRGMFENPETKRAVIRILDREDDLFTLMTWISDTTWASEANCLAILEALNEERLVQRINEENDVAVIGYAIGNVPWPIEAAGSEVDRIEKERYQEAKLIYDLGEVDFCIWRIPFNGPESVRKKVDVDLSVARLRQRPTTLAEVREILPCVRSIFAGEATLCAKSLFCRCPDLGVRVVRKLDLDILAEKADRESNLFKLAYCIANIDWADRQTAVKLVGRLSIESLQAKLEAEKDLGKAILLLWQVSRINPAIAQAVLDALPKHIVEEVYLPSGWIPRASLETDKSG